jgi:hypothetical protein
MAAVRRSLKKFGKELLIQGNITLMVNKENLILNQNV